MEIFCWIYGFVELVCRGMELGIVRWSDWKFMVLNVGGLFSLYEEILKGREDMIFWEDVFIGEEMRSVL